MQARDSFTSTRVPSDYLYLESANKKQFNWCQTFSLSRAKIMQGVGCPLNINASATRPGHLFADRRLRTPQSCDSASKILTISQMADSFFHRDVIAMTSLTNTLEARLRESPAQMLSLAPPGP